MFPWVIASGCHRKLLFGAHITLTKTHLYTLEAFKRGEISFSVLYFSYKKLYFRESDNSLSDATGI